MKTSKSLMIFSAVFPIVLLAAACSRQQGAVAGAVTPGYGIHIQASQNGKIILSTAPDRQDGRFSFALDAGTYDISVSSPASPFPMVFHAVSVQQGKTTQLSSIDLPVTSVSKTVLSGRIRPAGAGMRVVLLADGREQASISTDREGQFIFKEIPAGSYMLHAEAPNYAPDELPVTVPAGGASTLNLSLLYISDIKGVDWTSGTIRASGIGFVPRDARTPTIGREMARRAALADAERNLMRTVQEIKTGPNQNLRSRMKEKKFSEKIEGFVKGYKIVGERELEEGKIQTELELPLTGASGLSRYLPDTL